MNINNNNVVEEPIPFYQKFLVVDDQVAGKKSYRQDFIIKLGVSEELALFASSYDEALKIINSHSDIAICYVDCRIPKESSGLYSFEPTKSEDTEWGISLIPQINRILEKTAIAVYSAYTAINQIMERVSKFKNIVDCYSDYASSNYKFDRKKLYEEAVQKLLFANFSPQLNASKEKSFDYESLDPELRLLVQSKTEEIKRLLRRSAQDVVDIGKYLIEVKSHLKHGQFYPWLEEELQWSGASAARFMQVYRRLKSINLTDLSGLDIVPTALYKLTAPVVPDSGVLEMKRLAQLGTTIDLETAELVKNKYKKPNKKQDAETALGKKQLSIPLQTEAKLLDRTTSNSKKENPVVNQIKQSVVRIISRQNRWQLENHLIICAEPNSDEFIELLPKQISLCLCFPPEEAWNFNSNSHCKSKLSFYSEYLDLDPIAFLKSIQLIVEISTNSQDSIVTCYIPHPNILELIARLGCRAYIAEPDYQKCLDLVDSFTKSS